ncbi:hypothetical protein LSAT2_025921 [Lamellibrachia satsuma]|nr:hypothetical protein LSAT2_025921 [Lamellibrachia satsuma]
MKKQLDREETTRAEAEKARLRRLMMEGVITADDLRADPCMLQEYQQHMKKLDGDKRRGSFLREPPQREKPRRRKRKRRHNEPQSCPYENEKVFQPQSCPYENEKEEEMTDVEHELEEEEPRLESKDENINDTASQRNVGLFSGSTTAMQQLSEKQLPAEKTRRWPRHTSPLLEQMRREETLDGLYSVAEKIIIQIELEDGTKIHM